MLEIIEIETDIESFIPMPEIGDHALNLLHLPEELLLNILHRLPLEEIHKVSITCQRFYQLTNDKTFFQRHLVGQYQDFLESLEDFGSEIPVLSQSLVAYNDVIKNSPFKKRYLRCVLFALTIMVVGACCVFLEVCILVPLSELGKISEDLFLWIFVGTLGMVLFAAMAAVLIKTFESIKNYLLRKNYTLFDVSADPYQQWLYSLKIQHQMILKDYQRLLASVEPFFIEELVTYLKKFPIEQADVLLINMELSEENLHQMEDFIFLAKVQTKQVIAALQKYPHEVAEIAKVCKAARNSVNHSGLRFFSRPQQYVRLAEESPELVTDGNDDFAIIVEKEGRTLEKELAQERELASNHEQSLSQDKVLMVEVVRQYFRRA